MGSVKWDIKEIRSQHSNYVDRLLQVCLHTSELGNEKKSLFNVDADFSLYTNLPGFADILW